MVQDEILKETRLIVARIVGELALITLFDPASILDEFGHLPPANQLPPFDPDVPLHEQAESPFTDLAGWVLPTTAHITVRYGGDCRARIQKIRRACVSLAPVPQP